MKYGSSYAIVDFIDRLISKSGRPNSLFPVKVTEGLKRLLALQETNAWVTMNATVSAGIWVFYRGQRRWLINPAQAFLRVENALGVEVDDVDIEPALEVGVSAGTVERTSKEEFAQWRVYEGGLELLWGFFENLPQPERTIFEAEATHARTFPGWAREGVLMAFEASGRICPGVSGKRDMHPVSPADRIEFDHILPHSRQGSNGPANIQVLCQTCNRIKRDSAR